jgi:hypothetical protein
LGAKEDGREVFHWNLSRENVGAHVGDNNRARSIGPWLKRLGECRKLNPVDRLVVAVIDEGCVFGQIPGALVRDGSELATVRLPGICCTGE